MDDWNGWRGDASWMAATLIGSLGDVPTVQLVRNPLDTLRSLVGIAFLGLTRPGHRPYEDHVNRTLRWKMEPTRARDTLIARNGLFITHWSDLIEAHRLPRHRIEDITTHPGQLRVIITDLTGDTSLSTSALSAAIANTPGIRSRDRDDTITGDDAPALRPLAERWGYTTD